MKFIPLTFSNKTSVSRQIVAVGPIYPLIDAVSKVLENRQIYADIGTVILCTVVGNRKYGVFLNRVIATLLAEDRGLPILVIVLSQR